VNDRHLPRQALIDSYGGGGFRFAGLSHRGSLLSLPDGIWAWRIDTASALTDEALAPIFERADTLDFSFSALAPVPGPRRKPGARASAARRFHSMP
jgi:uncharacterized protein